MERRGSIHVEHENRGIGAAKEGGGERGEALLASGILSGSCQVSDDGSWRLELRVEN